MSLTYKNCTYLRFTTWCFDVPIHWKIIPTIKETYPLPLHSYHCVSVYVCLRRRFNLVYVNLLANYKYAIQLHCLSSPYCALTFQKLLLALLDFVLFDQCQRGVEVYLSFLLLAGVWKFKKKSSHVKFEMYVRHIS